MTAAQEKNIPIILRPPMRITLYLTQVLKLVKDFPLLMICQAHLGLTKTVISGLEDVYMAIARFPQVYFDTALVPSVEVVEMAMRTIGVNRIMYGSDEPLNLIRSVLYTHPQHGEKIVTSYLYH